MREPDEPEVSKEDGELVRLMVAYQEGRIEAFEGLYAALAADLARFFAGAISERGAGRETGAAQDLVQETFLEIHRARRTYLPPLPVRPWAFGVAKNVLARHRRGAARRARHEGGSLDAAGEPREPAAAAALASREVAQALERLPAGRRQVWLLHHVHGFSFQQIALRFGIGEGAAKLRSSRAMKALRASLRVAKGARDG